MLCTAALRCSDRAPPPAPIAEAPSAGGSPASPPTVDFALGGAPGWTAKPCDRAADPACVGEWLHAESEQVARVSAVPVRAPEAVPVFFDKLKADVAAQGGLADVFSLEGWSGVRFLQPAGTNDGLALVGVSYALVAPDKRTIHVASSIVDVADQEAGDARLRSLLGSAVWTVR